MDLGTSNAQSTGHPVKTNRCLHVLCALLSVLPELGQQASSMSQQLCTMCMLRSVASEVLVQQLRHIMCHVSVMRPLPTVGSHSHSQLHPPTML